MSCLFEKSSTMFFLRLIVAVSLAISLFFIAPANAEIGVTSNSITFGMSAPFVGSHRLIGQDMLDAIRNYFAQVNAKGGVHGRMLELDAIDDDMEVSKTRHNTLLFAKERQAFALIGYCGDDNTAAAMEVANANKIPMIGAVSGAGNLRQPVSRYLFHTRASNADEINAIVNQLARLGLTRIAVFYQNDRFGTAGLNEVTAALKKYTLAPAAVGMVDSPSTFVSEVNVTAAFNAISKVKPQAILLLTSYEAAAALVKQMHKADLYPQYLALSAVGTDPLIQQLGGLARGIGISQVMPYPWDDTKSLVKDYQTAMKSVDKDADFSYASLEGYMMARVMVEGLKRAGKDLSREKLINALEAMEMNLGGYRIKYTADNHNGSNLVNLTVVGANGRVLN